VSTTQIEEAYEPFAAALRAGGFGEPDTGWTAGQIGAHIALNNELLSQAAETLHETGAASYDNHAAIDDEGLLGYAQQCGGLGGLADAVQASAARLARAYQNLTEEERERPVPALIVDGGQVVADEPMPLGHLIPGNGDFHLAMHLTQLQSLPRQS
jgi:hypothetical protein